MKKRGRFILGHSKGGSVISRQGFSLLELLVVVGLLGVLSSAIAAALFTAQRSWATGSGQVVLTMELRRALDAMSRELVSSRPAQIQRPAANGVWDTQMIFRVPRDLSVPTDGNVLDASGNIAEWSNDITYSVVGGTNRCDRTELGPVGTLLRSTLANHVTNVQFRRQAATPDVVEIQLTTQTITDMGQVTQPRTMATRVKLRN